MPSSDVPSTRQSARQAANTSSALQPSHKRPAVHQPPAKKKKTATTNNKKKKRTSTDSVGNLPPCLHKRPGPPQPYVRHKSAPPAIKKATAVLEPPSSHKGDSTIAKVKFLATENGQKLSAIKIYAYADAVAFRWTVGAIYTNKKHEVVVKPIKGKTKPTGLSLNNVTAWTLFALSE
jgi:hypothetical protein